MHTMIPHIIDSLQQLDHVVLSKFLSVLALALGVVALFSSLFSDVFFCADRLLAYAGLLSSVVCTALGGVAALFSGYTSLHREGYELWQPFRGGLSFIILQYFGWLFFGVSITMFTVFTFSFQRLTECKSGTVAAVGCLAFSAILTLLASIPRFDATASPLLSQLKLIKTDNLVVVACLAASMVFSVLIEIDPATIALYRSGLVASLFAVNFVSVFVVVVIGRRRFRGLKIFHPFQGGFYFVLMQSSGWAGVGVATFFFLRFAVDRMLPGMLVGVTFLHVSSVWLLLLSLDCFEEASNLGMLKRFRLTPEIVALMLIGVVAFITITICDLAGVQYSFLYHFALLCQAVVPPVTHVYASLVIKHYKLWQPFSGGSRFIVLHGIAWAVYALSHMVLLLAIWNRIYAVVAASSLFVLVTEVLLCASLHVFDELPPRESSSRDTLTPNRRRLRPSLDAPISRATRDSRYLNGELVTSVLMSIGGCMTLMVADYSEQTLFHRAHICIFGILVMLLAPTLAQISGRRVHPLFCVMRPFYGGPDHVALQTVGWTLWGVTVVVFAILEANLFLSEAVVPRGAATISGCVSFFSYGLIVASIPLFQPTPQAATTNTSTPLVSRQRVDGIWNRLEFSIDVADSQASMQAWRQAAAEAVELMDSATVTNPQLKILLSSFARHMTDVADTVPPQQPLIPPTSPGGTESLSQKQEREEDGMGFLAVSLSGGSLVLGPVCEMLFFVLDEPMKTAAVGPTTVAMHLACIAACLITHLVSGRRRFPHRYHVWMPFGGGSNFALLQTIGWALVSVHLSLLSASLYTFYSVGTFSLFTGMFFAIGFFGFAGHMFLMVSLSQFDVNAESLDEHSKSFLHRNSEWFVGSILTVLFIASITLMEMQLKETGRVSVATVPLLFAGILSCAIVVALGWRSVQKSRKVREVPPPTLPSSSTPYPMTMLTETVVGTVGLLWMLQNLWSIASNVWVIYLALLTVVYHVVVLFTIVWHEHHSITIVWKELLSEVATFTMYSFHYLVIAALVYMGFFFKLSLGSFTFFIAMNALSFGSESICRLVQVVCLVMIASDVCTWTCENAFFMLPLLFYTFTYRGTEQLNRSRWLPALSHTWLPKYFDAVAHYFSMRLSSEFKPLPPAGQQGQLSDRDKVIFGFHPHGVCPYTCLWATMGSLWEQRGLPRPVVHVSSFLMAVPIVRDVLLACGVVDCSVEALNTSRLNPNVRAMLIVPGGSKECSQPECSSLSVTLVTRNKGLFRFALVHGATLVPIFCFGETDTMNGVPLPTFQFWARRKLGITYPQLPHGRLLLPLPRRVPLYLAIGEGIRVTPVIDPTPKQVDVLHEQYYAQLSALFDRHKAEAGFPHAELILV